MYDLRLVVPVITEQSHPAGRTPPSGFLVLNMSRLDGDARPQLFDGVQKLVAQVYLEIFTDPLPNGIGSGLASRLRTADDRSIEAVAHTGITDVLARITRYQEGQELPPDERIAGLVLREFTYDDVTASFVMVLELTTAAGNQFELRAPLT